MGTKMGRARRMTYSGPRSFGRKLRRYTRILLCVSCSGLAVPAFAEEAAWTWRAGDLIFRSGLDPLDDVIAEATQAEFGSVAIVRAGSGGPHVVYVDAEEGVTEAMLADFVVGLGVAEYAVYRPRDMADWGQGDSPISYNALLVAYGRAADRFRLMGGDTYYGAELVYLAALGAGVALGAPVKLSELAQDSPELEAAFLTDWQDHPYCTYVVSRDDCWDVLQGTAMVTTAGIQGASGLERLYPLPE